MTQMEYQEQLITSFRKIRSKNPGIANFLDLVYNEILVFLKDNDSYGIHLSGNYNNTKDHKFSFQKADLLPHLNNHPAAGGAFHHF